MKQKVKGQRQPRTRLSRKHQVTIPVAVLRQAGLAVADVLEVRAEPGCIVLTRTAGELDSLFGSLPGVWPRGALEGLRSEWER